MEAFLLDAAGRRRSPATMPGFHRGRPPRNKGLRYPPDPPSVEEIVAVMRATGDTAAGVRMRGLIVVLWRAGLRISEALSLAQSDLDQQRGAILVRRGKGGKRREVGMDRWAWEQLRPWLQIRTTLPVGMLLCVIHGPTRGRPWAASSAREELRAVPSHAGVRETVRSASASPRSCCRDGERGRPARRHPAPTRPHRFGRDLGVPARHRQRGDHRHGPRAPRADDASKRRGY
jgi:integrase